MNKQEVNINSDYKICKRCVMDTSTKTIVFDQNGICNFCHDYDKNTQNTIFRPKELRDRLLKETISKIKEQGKGNDYDCILGVSGGVDSSYLAIKAKEFGLRPLFVHFDNGWDSELAVQNITNLLDKLEFDLSSYVIDWETFKELQKAYFNASVIDIEVPTDQLIFSSLFKIARKHKIKTILSGHNPWTESHMATDWVCNKKFDWTNMKNINQQHGTLSINKFPKLGLAYRQQLETMGYKMIKLYHLMDFDLPSAIKTLENQYNYKTYQCKHYESIFTRFYQGYILPKKFGVDKRRSHLSTLICSNFKSRDEALEELKSPPYPVKDQKEDQEYIIKKWGITLEHFNKIMLQAPVPHHTFGWDKETWIDRLKNYFLLVYKYKIKPLIPS